ncbi:MAG: L,D-transpeptidase family protein [Rhodoferax sp.]
MSSERTKAQRRTGVASAAWMGLLLLALGLAGNAQAAPRQIKKALASQASTPTKTRASLGRSPTDAENAGMAEARLIEIYKLIGAEKPRQALEQALRLVRDYPHFQLAHLVLGDLLSAQSRPLQGLGDVPGTDIPNGAASTLADLRLESARRMAALREAPPPGLVPSQFVNLSPQSRHAIAIDAARSRLYLFENGGNGLRLVAHYYISVGKAGTLKRIEGDQKTPLGIYYITSSIDRSSLEDFYGAGALPINYPNVLDLKRGKTGSGIWLHGTPPNQFSRAPQASDGCVVLANPDLEHVMRTVRIRTTPVVIAPQLHWVAPHKARTDAREFEDALAAWRDAKSSGRSERVLRFYTHDFSANGKDLAQWSAQLQTELRRLDGRPLELKDVSMLRWTDGADTMVVTFGEVARGQRSGTTKRQYWVRESGQWKIFYEGVV